MRFNKDVIGAVKEEGFYERGIIQAKKSHVVGKTTWLFANNNKR